MKQWAMRTLALTTLISSLGFAASAADREDSRSRPKSRVALTADGTLSTESGTARSGYRGLRKRLAVTVLERQRLDTSASPTMLSGDPLSIPADYRRGTTELLIAALARTNQFVVLEREAPADLREEEVLEESDPLASPGVVGAGRGTDAQFVLRGAITELTYRRSRAGDPSIFGASGRDTARVVVRVRLFDTASGQLSATIRAAGQAQAPRAASNGTRDEIRFDSTAFKSSPLGRATQEAVAQAAAGIAEHLGGYPWRGRVADVQREGESVTEITIAAGSDDGLAPGDELQILQPGREVIDPETGVVMGRTSPRLLGTCRIESVRPRTATAVPLTGSAFQPGALARFRRRSE